MPADAEARIRLYFRRIGRAGTSRSLSLLLAAASRRARSLGLEPAAYAEALEKDPSEALAVLDARYAERPPGRGCFPGPAAFRVIPDLAREWSAFAPERRLTALVLRCGRGWPCVSLAASLAAAGLPEKAWTLEVTGLDVSLSSLAAAASLGFGERDLEGFPYPQGKWFRAEAGGVRRFKGCEGLSLAYGFGDPYLPAGWGLPADGEAWPAAGAAGGAKGAGPAGEDSAEASEAFKGLRPPRPLEASYALEGADGLEADGGLEDEGCLEGEENGAGEASGSGLPGIGLQAGGLRNLLPGFRGKVDFLLAADVSSEAPDELSGVVPELVLSLLADGGLAFTCPGEIWAPPPGLSLEERGGVFYFRKSLGKRKGNAFFTPRRRRGASAARGAPAAAAESARAPDPGAAAAAAAAAELVERSGRALSEDPEAARELARDAARLGAEASAVWPPAYEALARAEEALGRPSFARQIREAMGLYSEEP
ncbi:MAG: hypothetical protein LBW85_02755 [Deltaproteobacteria bacterium]|nr:hypothetical protein [Deltaproteobacteria bacterium]